MDNCCLLTSCWSRSWTLSCVVLHCLCRCFLVVVCRKAWWSSQALWLLKLLYLGTSSVFMCHKVFFMTIQWAYKLIWFSVTKSALNKIFPMYKFHGTATYWYERILLRVSMRHHRLWPLKVFDAMGGWISSFMLHSAWFPKVAYYSFKKSCSEGLLFFHSSFVEVKSANSPVTHYTVLMFSV